MGAEVLALPGKELVKWMILFPRENGGIEVEKLT